MRYTWMKKTLIASSCAAMLMQATPAFATSLLQAYQAALQNDPQHRSAKAENISGQQFEVIGRAGLLPQVQYSYSTYANKGESTAPAGIFGFLQTTNLDYRSSSKGVSVRQTLFNLDTYARFKQGEAQTKYSDAQFDARAKDLMIRVMTAYADAKYAEDQLELYQAQRDAYLEQRKVNDRLFEKGEGTKTDMLETQAKLDVSEALVIEATDNLLNARTTLNSVTGLDITKLDSLRDNVSVDGLVQGDFESWRLVASKNNPELRAAQLAVEIATQEIEKAKGGHAPRVDLNANYNHGTSENVSTRTQDNNVRSIGVQVTIPIYSGGYANAVYKQSVAQKEKALADLDGVRNKVMTELRKQHSSVKSSVQKIDAFQKSVSSASLLVEATKQSVKGGIRINLDSLNAQHQLVTAKRDLAQARYNFLVSYVKLKVTAGTATMDDLQIVSNFFASN